MSSTFPAGILCALGMLAWSACASRNVPTATEITLTESHEVQAVRASVGSLIRVRLSATPGTGYGWQWAELNREVLHLEGEETLQPADKPGGATLVEYRLRAVKPASTRVRLEYRRPWEQNQATTRTFTATVEVMPATTP